MRFACIFISIVCFSLSACAQHKDFDDMIDNTISGTVDLIYPDSIQDTEEFLFLDTRQLEEFEVSHIEGAQFAEYDSFKVKQLKDVEKDQPIVVYCTVGYRSEKIGEKLIKAGYTEVYNLYGGIFEWKNGGKEVVDQDGEVTEEVHCYNKEWSQWLTKGNKVY